MIDRSHKLPLTRQTAILGISRGSCWRRGVTGPADRERPHSTHNGRSLHGPYGREDSVIHAGVNFA
jgi:hypothetical protein